MSLEVKFTKEDFEAALGDAGRLHWLGYHDPALAVGMRAYKMAPDDSIEQGRAARAIGTHWEGLGEPLRAEGWILEAYGIHDESVRSLDRPSQEMCREAFRERSMSAVHVGISGLRRTIQATRAGRISEDLLSLAYLQEAWSDVRAAKRLVPGGMDKWIDQYEINAAYCVSIGESILGSRGSRWRALGIGARAVCLAAMSESKLLRTSSPNATAGQRVYAKAKALAGGVAAIGVAVLATPKEGRRQKAALWLADHSL